MFSHSNQLNTILENGYILLNHRKQSTTLLKGRALLRLERTMNLLEGGKGGEGRVGEKGWEGTEGGWGERVGERGGWVGREGRVGGWGGGGEGRGGMTVIHILIEYVQ